MVVVVVVVVVVDEGEELAVFHPSESNVGLRPIGYIVENFRRKYYTNFNANLVYLFLVVVTISTFFFFKRIESKYNIKEFTLDRFLSRLIFRLIRFFLNNLVFPCNF